MTAEVSGTPMAVGDVVTVDITSVAHGGHCVGRVDGVVVFVRHALPGERVRARITARGPKGRYFNADAVEVLVASPSRVVPPCRYAGTCGGCDWQHVAVGAQRDLKGDVLREVLRGAVDEALLQDLVVQEVPGAPGGLRWRTRTRFRVTPSGQVALLKHHSHTLVPVDDCLIAPRHPSTFATTWKAREVILTDAGAPQAFADPIAGRARVTYQAAGRSWRTDVAGFWQVHHGAATALAECAVTLLRPAPGETVCDLYAGVGLFAGSLAAHLGPGGRVHAVEQDAYACRNARRNLHDLDTVTIINSDVGRWLHAERPTADAVVLDPPRSGAGAAVVRSIAATGASRIVYISCEPSTLARDLRTFADDGYRVTELHAFDCFPMTQHIETAVLLRRSAELA